MKKIKSIKYDKLSLIKNEYLENGYIAVKGLIDIKLLDKVAEDLTEIFNHYNGSENLSFDEIVLNLDKNDSLRKKLHRLHIITSKMVSFSPIKSIILDFIKNIDILPLLEIDASYLFGIPNDRRLSYTFHQEANYMKNFDNIYNIHFPIFRQSNLKNGSMSILEKTDTLGTLDYNKIRLSDNSYTNLIPKKINQIKSKFMESYFELDRGDVVIFSKNIIHKSNKNESETCRTVGVFRFTTSLNGDWDIKTPEEL